jgi:glycerol uptake facilitator-like aquaporin
MFLQQVTVGKGLGTEMVLTALFVFAVFAATDQTRGATTPHIPALAPFAIGIAVFLAHLVAVPVDGCSINPARSFGAAVTSNMWHQHWIFWLGPLVAGGVVGALYEMFAYRALSYVGPLQDVGDHRRRAGSSPAGPQEFAA